MGNKAPVLEVPEAIPIALTKAATRQYAARFQKARSVVVGALRLSPGVVAHVASLPEKLYQVEIPQPISTGIAEGALTWVKRADGTFPAVIRTQGNSAIAKHVSLREVDFAPTAASLNALAIQTALVEVIARLEDIQEGVTHLIASARADRHGLVNAGGRLYEQALAMSSGQDRSTALLNAIQTLETGRSQLLENIGVEASRLERPGLFKSFASGMKLRTATATKKLEVRFGELSQDFALCIAATQWATLAYEELGHRGAAQQCLVQLGSASAVFAPKLMAVADGVPYRPEHDPTALWAATSEKLLPAAERSGRLLRDPPESLLVTVRGKELLDG